MALSEARPGQFSQWVIWGEMGQWGNVILFPDLPPNSRFLKAVNTGNRMGFSMGMPLPCGIDTVITSCIQWEKEMCHEG